MVCFGVNGDYPRSPQRPQVENQPCNFGTTVLVNWKWEVSREARTSENERETQTALRQFNINTHAPLDNG